MKKVLVIIFSLIFFAAQAQSKEKDKMWFEILNDSVLYYGIKNTVRLHGLTDTSGYNIVCHGGGLNITKQEYVYIVILHDFNAKEAAFSVWRYGAKVPNRDTLPLKKIPNPIVSFQSKIRGEVFKDSLVKINKTRDRRNLFKKKAITECLF